MATARVDATWGIETELNARLSSIIGVTSVYVRWLDDVLNVWIGVREDDDISRGVVYEFENAFLDRYPDLLVDFHVVSIPQGKGLQDYISDADIVFQRSAVA